MSVGAELTKKVRAFVAMSGGALGVYSVFSATISEGTLVISLLRDADMDEACVWNEVFRESAPHKRLTSDSHVVSAEFPRSVL